MNRQVFLAVITYAVLVGALLATFALASGSGDKQCRLAAVGEFQVISAQVSPLVPSSESEDVTKAGTDKAADPFSECYQTCRIDDAQSTFMTRLCWLSCAYSAYGVPAGM